MSTARIDYEGLKPAGLPAPRSGNLIAAPYLVSCPDAARSGDISVALIGPNEFSRAAAAMALADCPGNTVREFSSYPSGIDDLPRMLDSRHDVVIVDLDSDPEAALDLVRNISSYGNSKVMVYSTYSDPKLLLRSMRAGAREFLTLPFDAATIAEALSRTPQQQQRPAAEPGRAGKLLLFAGAKGGVGVTSVACNFAVALAQEPEQKTILIDLDLPLGDAALNLGIVSEFSTVTALEATDRLDGALLSRLLVQHSSGVWVLAAPGRFPHYAPSSHAIEKLLAVARQEFDNVVVDAGSHLDLAETPLLVETATTYLVTQAGIPELRNSNRLINKVFSNGGAKLEIVLNRAESRTAGISDAHVTKALTRPAQWKVPNDQALVCKMQIEATPLVLTDSPLARAIRKMAESVNGKPPALAPARKKGFSLFG